MAITYPFQTGGPEIKADGSRYIVTQPGGGMILAYADTRDEADEAASALSNLGQPSWTGLTRNEAIELCNGAIERLSKLAKGRKNGAPFVAGVTNGTHAALRALADGGAFSDGRNMSDRLPTPVTGFPGGGAL